MDQNEPHTCTGDHGVKEANGEKNGKGKGMEVDESLGKRMQASAMMAARAFTAPQEVPALGSSGKTSDANGTYNSRGTPSHRTAGEASSSTNQSRPKPTTRFRNADSTDAADEAFQDFLQDRSARTDHGIALATSTKSGLVEAHEAADGSDVVQLLSHGENYEDEIGPFNESNWPLKMGNQLRTDLSHPETTTEWSWNSVLDFTPVFFQDPDPPLGELERHFGTADKVAAREIWLDQWSRVLSSYNEEIWGDLNPLTDLARSEVSAMRASFVNENVEGNSKSLERLRQILAHVRGATH